MKNVTVLIVGYPGVGKTTTGQALEKLDKKLRLIDFDALLSPVHEKIQINKTMPNYKWLKTHLKAELKLKMVDFVMYSDVSDNGFIFSSTNSVTRGSRMFVKKIRHFAKKRGTILVPIILKCDLKKHSDRIQKRKSNPMQSSCLSDLQDRFKRKSPTIKDKYRLEIDNTNQTPIQTARIILKHIKKIQNSQI